MNKNQRRILKIQKDLEKLKIEENRKIKNEFNKILDECDLYKVLNSKNINKFKNLIESFIAEEKMEDLDK